MEMARLSTGEMLSGKDIDANANRERTRQKRLKKWLVILVRGLRVPHLAARERQPDPARDPRVVDGQSRDHHRTRAHRHPRHGHLHPVPDRREVTAHTAAGVGLEHPTRRRRRRRPDQPRSDRQHEPVPRIGDVPARDGRQRPARRAVRRASRNGQDLPRQGDGRRGRRAVPVRVGQRVPVDVLRPDEQEDPFVLQGAAQGGSRRGRRDRVHRGVRRHRWRPQRHELRLDARGHRRRRQRVARPDAELRPADRPSEVQGELHRLVQRVPPGRQAPSPAQAHRGEHPDRRRRPTAPPTSTRRCSVPAASTV